jgi:hypothetical protein
MATRSLFKVKNADGSFEVYDNNGTIELRINGTKIATVQQSTITALTDNSGGTADNTLVAISGTYVQAEIRNNFADLAAKVNELRTAIATAGIIA